MKPYLGIISCAFLICFSASIAASGETKYIPPSGSQKHPEKRHYEYWITNTTDCSHFTNQVTNYKTVRCGNIAFDINDKPVERMTPVFVKKYEYHTFNSQSVMHK